ncbi:hypothetical protein BCR43DRAFT_499811 [Syncephalastrum racemosum]|uniref:Inhibitor I9 domain-containing protein n=1 Tax=Syncephalastrum racemosum TaxID=13706 RepID=A0A1X2GZN4_SYNRA|nr:hypothetical protein BCR43DRAFT_499811 [Syncephalastrum racemosum]
MVSRLSMRGVTQVGGVIASSSLPGSARVLRRKRASICSGRAPPLFVTSFTTLPTFQSKKMSSTFIVTFKNGTPDNVIENHVQQAEASGAKVKHRYNSAIKGYSVEVPDNTVSTLSFDHPDIQDIEADGEVTTQGASLLKK